MSRYDVLPRLPILPVILAAGFLAACSASPTPYQAESDGYGYREQQIETDRYRVTFTGNAATSRETVENFALYRAAELTLQLGKDHFKVVERDIDAVYGASRSASPSIGLGVGSGGGNFGVGLSTIIGGGGGASANYAGYFDIVVFEGDKPEGDASAYDAWEVVERLKPPSEAGGEGAS